MANKNEIKLVLRPISDGVVMWKLDFLKLVKKALYWVLNAPKVVTRLNTASALCGALATTTILLKLLGWNGAWWVILLPFGFFLAFAFAEAGVIMRITRVMEKLQRVFVIKELNEQGGLKLTWPTGYRSAADDSHVCSQPWLEYYVSDIELTKCECTVTNDDMPDWEILDMRAKFEEGINKNIAKIETKKELDIPVYKM